MALFQKKFKEYPIDERYVKCAFRVDPDVLVDDKNNIVTFTVEKTKAEVDAFMAECWAAYEKMAKESPAPEPAKNTSLPAKNTDSAKYASLPAENAGMEDVLKIVPEAPDPESAAWKNKEKQRKRSNQIMTRLTDEELATFKSRVESTGQSQADFIRSAILMGQINELPKTTPELIELNRNLEHLKANIGKIGGLLKAAIKPNEKNPLVQDELDLIKEEIKELKDLQKQIRKELNNIWLS